MSLITKESLLRELDTRLDNSLVARVIEEFISLERRYVLRDWEPAELDAGQFCELLARVLYHLDSGTLNLTKGHDECLRYIENDTVPHTITPRHDALHLVAVMRPIYKFRSQRGAVHISPTYSPNQLDARFMIEAVRWCFCEFLRLFWKGDREAVAKAIRELLQFDVPCIGKFEGLLLVQRTDVNAEEELLLLLHYAGESGFTRNELGRHCSLITPSTISKAIQRLVDSRQVVLLPTVRYRLTDLGSQRVRESLAPKLVEQ